MPDSCVEAETSLRTAKCVKNSRISSAPGAFSKKPGFDSAGVIEKRLAGSVISLCEIHKASNRKKRRFSFRRAYPINLIRKEKAP